MQSDWIKQFIQNADSFSITITSLLEYSQLLNKTFSLIIVHFDNEETVNKSLIFEIISQKDQSKIYFLGSTNAIPPKDIFSLWRSGIHALIHIADEIFNLTYLQSMTFSGVRVISPVFTESLLSHLIRDEKLISKLSEKECFILQKLSEGYNYEGIAKSLNLSLDGVRYHIRKLYKSLGVTNKTDAILEGIKLNIVKVNKLN